MQSSCGQLWVLSGLFAAAFSSGWDNLAGLDCLLSDLKSPFEKGALSEYRFESETKHQLK